MNGEDAHAAASEARVIWIDELGRIVELRGSIVAFASGYVIVRHSGGRTLLPLHRVLRVDIDAPPPPPEEPQHKPWSGNVL